LALGTLKAQSAARIDWNEAAHWYSLAADAGHPAAMVALAQVYESGRGVGIDGNAALAWYRRALAAGEPDAAIAVERLGAALSR
jgi:TPR repeat protein